MHCPKCGQQQISDEIRYCSRCGFLLIGIAEVIANDGLVPNRALPFAGKDSPKRRGIKQGAFIFLLTFFVVPILSIISLAGNWEPVLPAIGAILFICGGMLRMIYALMFESSVPGTETVEEKLLAASHGILRKKQPNLELPPTRATPANAYAAPATGAWQDTNDLARPGSVTDSTTKLLSKEAEDQ